MAYLTPQQIFQQLLIEREQAVRREFAVYRGEEVDDEFERKTRPTKVSEAFSEDEPLLVNVSEKAERKGKIRI